MNRPTKQFKEIACSFYGCDGGNLDSDFWFCGLEWGGDISQIKALVRFDDPDREHGYLAEDGKTLNFCENISWTRSFKGAHTNQYNETICKFLNKFQIQTTINDYENFIKENEILFNTESGIGFKMNMFLINSPKHDSEWEEKHIRITGFHNRNDYQKWCVQGERAIFFQNLIREHQPKYLICTGITSANHFLDFFGCQVDPQHAENDDVRIVFSQIPNTKTNIIIVPFFGFRAYSINTEEKLDSLIALIKNNIP